MKKEDIHVDIIPLKNSNQPQEGISFPSFEYKKLIETDWEKSFFKNISYVRDEVYLK
ncbi:hypothetical protein [uncultured Gelidibacter sp.]|uniref:hypothetical protein n=1 Tax=uncultured Gelidibacter sp. TaxID=259318 RepID=UPI00262EA5D0|nr:hypothetical protein [uncultured Gelidibacter sp.]